MPKLVSEVVSGSQFTRSMQDGSVADSQVRVFKIILSAPNEVIDPQTHCNIRVGDQHPINTNIVCKSFDVRFDGDSRAVMVVTFNYESAAHSSQQDQNNKPPELRAANWTTSTSLIEAPVYRWRKRNVVGWAADEPAVNPAGDIYDAVTQLTSIVNISVEQFSVLDPTRFNLYGGYINDNVMTLGNLAMQPHTVMFRGVTSQPHIESWGGEIRRGWKSTYEFAFKRNLTRIMLGAGEGEVDMGWDIAVPQTGFNVSAFTPPGGGSDDQFGQPLKHADGRIGFDEGLPLLPIGVADGDKVRAMVRVFSYEDGGVSQAPSASPIPLNDNGRPRINTANPKVLVYGYQVQPSINLVQTLELRLE